MGAGRAWADVGLTRDAWLRSGEPPGRTPVDTSMLALIVSALLAVPTWVPAQPVAIDSVGGIRLERKGLRDLSVRATFPKAGGPYPVIVLSHGMYGSEDVLGPLAKFWAERGYVVLQPTHDDSLRYADAETWREALRGSLDHIESWNQRPKDVSLILDSLDALTRKVRELKGRMDPKRIGMGGHSFGAWTTQVVAGMRIRGMGTSLADPRPQAFLVISPSGIGGGITKESFKSMRGPMLMVSGDKDRGRFEGDPAEHRKQAFEYGPTGDRWLLWIQGADHSFGGINGRANSRLLAGGRLSGTSNSKHVELVQKTSLAFWDATLKGDRAAREWLDRKEIEKSGGVTLSSR